MRPESVEVRAKEARELARQGYEPILKHTRWCFLKLGQRARHAVRPQHGSHDGETGLARQGPQREVRGVGAIDPRRSVAGPIGRDEEDRRRGEALDEERQILLGGLVDPVEILDEEDDGASPAALQAEKPTSRSEMPARATCPAVARGSIAVRTAP